MAKPVLNGLQLGGDPISRGSVNLVGILFDSNGNVLWGKGATVPADNKSGFAIGCLFIDTTGGANVTLYVNEGTAVLCDFNAAVNN